MAKGDQSVPIPDIPGFLGNAKESARQVDAALKEIDKQIKKTVRDGKEVDKEILVRQQKLLQVKRSTDEILKGQRSSKGFEITGKAARALVAGNVARDIAAGRFDVTSALNLIDDRTLERVAKVVTKAGFQKMAEKIRGFASVAGPVGFFATIAAERTMAAYTEYKSIKNAEDSVNRMVGTGQISAAEARIFDRKMSEWQWFGDKGEASLGALAEAQAAAKVAAAATDGELFQAIRKADPSRSSALTASNVKSYFNQKVSEEQARLGRALNSQELSRVQREAFATLLGNLDDEHSDAFQKALLEIGKRKDDELAMRMARKPTAAELYQEREKARISEIQFQRRRSRVPEIIYD